MEQKHVENISTLIHFMRSLHDSGFSMSRYHNGCGTPACALGWAATIPALRDQGINAGMFDRIFLFNGPMATARQVFGEYSDLFSVDLRQLIDTPQAWAEHATTYLRKKGHDVLPNTPAQRDDFTRFMESVMKPVKVTNPIQA